MLSEVILVQYKDTQIISKAAKILALLEKELECIYDCSCSTCLGCEKEELFSVSGAA